jgi:hypothetical protein
LGELKYCLINTGPVVDNTTGGEVASPRRTGSFRLAGVGVRADAGEVNSLGSRFLASIISVRITVGMYAGRGVGGVVCRHSGKYNKVFGGIGDVIDDF